MRNYSKVFMLSVLLLCSCEGSKSLSSDALSNAEEAIEGQGSHEIPIYWDGSSDRYSSSVVIEN